MKLSQSKFDTYAKFLQRYNSQIIQKGKTDIENTESILEKIAWITHLINNSEKNIRYSSLPLLKTQDPTVVKNSFAASCHVNGGNQ